MIGDLSDTIRSKEVGCDVVERFNTAGVRSCANNPKRTDFLKEIKAADFEITVRKYTKQSIYKRARRFAGRIKRKVLG